VSILGVEGHDPQTWDGGIVGVMGSMTYYHRHRLVIPTSTAIILVNSFIVSRVDYCNSLLACLPICQLERMQSAVNSAAHLTYGRTPSDHVTDLLRDNLHWLCVPQRITYKLCLITYKAIHIT